MENFEHKRRREEEKKKKEEEEQQWMDIQKYIKINEFVKIHFTKDSLVNFRGCVF